MVGQIAVRVLKRWRSWAKRRKTLLLLFAVGLFGLHSGLGWVALLAVVGTAIALYLIAHVSRYFRALALMLATVAVSWLCLLGFNVLLAQLPVPKPGLLLGLVLGALVFYLVATRLLVLWQAWADVAVGMGLLLALVNLSVAPLIVGLRAQPKKDDEKTGGISFQLDATIVVPGPTGDGLDVIDDSVSSPGWDVRFSVARATPGKRPEWLLLDSDNPNDARLEALGYGLPLPGKPEPRSGADQLVLLDVDGTPPVVLRPSELPEAEKSHGEVRREIKRWMATVAKLGFGRKVPVVALVQTTDMARLREWNGALEDRGGFALSAQRRPAGSITDAAVDGAVAAPTADEDLMLARRFRPLLLFDSSAKKGNDRPVDVDELLRVAGVELCHEDRVTGTSSCKRVRGAADLVNGDRHLRVPEEAAKLDLPARIYVHPTRVTDGERKLLYLDYWWYLLSNPNEVGLGGFCGAGLSLPGLTCFAHESDWEGVTVVVELTGDPVPVAVHYAQHSDVIRWSFDQLRKHDWNKREIRKLLHDVGVEPDDADARPLVFVAAGSHASYPTPCFQGCRQRVHKGTGEDRHDGSHERTRSRHDAKRCRDDICVRLTPTHAGGKKPALWNAFDGAWGKRSCILLGYCDAEVSPAAPGTQKRYKHPARITGYVDERGRYSRCGGDDKPACPPVPAAG